MSTWFTSDQHFGHTNIIQYSARPFHDAAHMTEELVARFNQTVAAEDTVIHVGDFALDERLVARILPRMRAKEHILVPGNHDRCHPKHRGHDRWAAKYRQWGFSGLYEELSMTFDSGRRVLVCHLPYVGDSSHNKERFSEWRPKDDGATWLLHGHVHEAWKVRDRMINVGVDQWDYAPVSAEQIETVIARGPVT